MEKSQKVTLLSIIILVGFTFGVIYHYILAYYLHAGEPYNTFVYPASQAFCDFTGMLPYIKDFAPYQQTSLWIVYFPLTYILMFPFSLFKPTPPVYLFYISGFVAYLIFMNIKMFSCKNLTKMQNFQNIFIITLLSYPILYNLDKGNIDMYLFVLFGLCVYAFKSEKYFISSILLALINAMKPFTILFLLLFLKKKKYKEFFFSIILTALLIIGGFMVLKGNFFDQICYLIKSVALFKSNYAMPNIVGMGFSSSLFMPLKGVFMQFYATPADIVNFIKIYGYISYAITGLTILFMLLEKSLWKQLTLIICNFILLPYITYDYKLIFLLIPIWLFINEKEKSRFDLAYLILFGLLFIPKALMIPFPAVNNTSNWLSFSAMVNPFIMIGICLLIILEQFLNKKVGN